MRMMMRVQVTVEKGNEAMQNGKLMEVIKQTMERIKPEAAYFGPFEGKRTGYFFFNLTDQTQLPPIADPLFKELHAEIVCVPVLNAEDLQKGFAMIGR